MENHKKSTKVGLVVSEALMVLAFLAQIISLATLSPISLVGLIIHNSLDIALIISIFLYAFWGYKKPHGNLLRVVFFGFGLYLAASAVVDISSNNFVVSGSCLIIAALICAYISGRLNKINKNKILLIVIGVLLVASLAFKYMLLEELGFVVFIAALCPCFCLAALSFAYTTRYEEHKSAGLEDN